jgi:hypothetical protein
MELSPARQKLLFVVIVVVLAILGYYVMLPALHHTAKAAAAGSSASPTAAQAPLVSTVAPPASQSPAGQSPADQSPSGGPVNIYNWLPFTEQDLAAAAAVTTQFCVDYDTYTYTESATAYVGKMSGLIVSNLAASLESAYAAPGVVATRTGQKQISSGTATIIQLRAFGPLSLTFVVTATQRIVGNKGTSNASPQFAVTVTGSGSNWQVSDIELASEGNT